MPCPTAKLMQPTKQGGGASPYLLNVPKPIPSFLDGSKHMFLGNKLYLLLVFVPLAFLSEHLEWADATIFGIACLAILPLAGLLGEATEQVALHTNETLGGLLNATFGNATEMIVCYFALKADLLDVVKVSLHPRQHLTCTLTLTLTLTPTPTLTLTLTLTRSRCSARSSPTPCSSSGAPSSRAASSRRPRRSTRPSPPPTRRSCRSRSSHSSSPR